MPGIYIHIPFCKQACHYCDFHFSTSLQNKKPFLSALEKEIELQKSFFEKESSGIINTIYFGGGTPSLLSYDELAVIFETLNKCFTISSTAEITLEANPDDLNSAKLKELANSPINRLSIGIQSFYDDDLKTSYDGSYVFNYLQKGNCTLFIYEDCNTCPSGKKEILIPFEITERNQVIDLDTIVIKKQM